jgi:predicted regulator of Ras-like GTPase activity (Roadblock/LC7/MglB family)
MKAGLQEINETAGVWGSLLCDNQGALIEQLTPPALNKPTLENISRHVIELFARVSEALPGLGEVIFHYQERKVFAVDLERAVLVVVCTPSVDISLLRMSVNVVIANWESDSRAQKQFEEHSVERL